MTKQINIGVLISGGGSNLQAIMDACEDGGIAGRICFVGSDSPAAQGLERAQKRNIPTFVVDYDKLIGDLKKYPEKVDLPSDFDLEIALSKQKLISKDFHPKKLRVFLELRAVAEFRLLEKMAQYPFDLLALAGFMRVLTPYFIDRINTNRQRPRIMNIHPALLPAFPGVDGYADTFAYGCKVGGCTVHFIDYGEDTGPIIGQKAFEILPGDSLEDVKKKGLSLEWALYPECIRLFAENRLKLKNYNYPNRQAGRKTRRIVEIIESRE